MALSRSSNRSSTNDDPIAFAACEQGDLQSLKVHLDSVSTSDLVSIRDGQRATLASLRCSLRTEHGATCAHDAAVCDQVQTLHYILNYQKKHSNQQIFSEKLHWSIRDGHGNTLLHLAAAYGSLRTVQYLLDRESADPHVRSYNSYLPVHYAASSGHDTCVKLLLSRAPDTVNEQTNTLFTPIYLACQQGSIETVKVLSSHGANFKLKDENGLNCLHAACQNAHLNIAQWLVEKQNANVNDVDYMSNTPLHYAAASGSATLLIYLLDNNARVIQSSNGDTPLHVAAENGHQGACAVLLERGGCSTTTRNNAQLTASDCASQYGFHSLANDLRLRANLPSHSTDASKNSNRIQLENATVVRLVVKKRHVTRTDASNQVAEDDLISESDVNNLSTSSETFVNSRFELSELRKHVDKYDARRRETSATDRHSSRLMHSLDSLNQQDRNRQRPKLPSEKYAPWLQNSNQTPQAFEEEILKLRANLRKAGRDGLLEKDAANIDRDNRRSRQSQSLEASSMSPARNDEISSSNSYEDYSDNPETNSWRRTGYQSRSSPFLAYQPHQFIALPSQLERPDWQRSLINRRQGVSNGVNPQS